MLPATIAIALLAALAGPPAARAQTPAASPATASLLVDHARYWLAHGQPAQAGQEIRRALEADPANADALAIQTRLQIAAGDQAAAAATLARLRAAHPADPRLAELAQALQAGPIDPALLAEARRLAQSGQAMEAVQTYRQAFHGTAPPPGLATEYYQTLAGTEGGWAPATTGLAALLERNPSNLQAQLAYATLLTYRAATRPAGIARLAALAAAPSIAAPAEAAWRQALLWLPVDAGSIASYRDFLARHPDDATLVARLTEAEHPVLSPTDRAGRARAAGFAALNQGRLPQAASDFTAALAIAPDDAEALGGLGLVRLRQGEMGQARTLLSRAIAADPAHAAQWQPALTGSEAARTAAAGPLRAQLLRQRAAATA
ncbi:MAG TPA: tetratricopeptide repeat protein, partial [Acetobacteraceae bacterium]|nr:tetratricopeptide repeat protein [Acetobacteraceae bacterium]